MLTLERVNELKNGSVEMVCSRLNKLNNDNYVLCGNTFHVNDFDEMLKCYGSLTTAYDDIDNISGYVILLIDGEICELWYTTTLVPYDINTYYYKIF